MPLKSPLPSPTANPSFCDSKIRDPPLVPAFFCVRACASVCVRDGNCVPEQSSRKTIPTTLPSPPLVLLVNTKKKKKRSESKHTTGECLRHRCQHAATRWPKLPLSGYIFQFSRAAQRRRCERLNVDQLQISRNRSKLNLFPNQAQSKGQK